MTLKSKKGMSIVEVMLATLIFVMIILGSALFFVYGTGHISLSKYYRSAVLLADQKLEQLGADNSLRIDIPDGETDENVSLGDLSFRRNTNTEDCGLYKKVEVGVHWTHLGKQRNISLVTLYDKR